ncbi:MAG TPA: 5-oxoprolinase subunit PxpA [Gammaproteobacteria bacterium]
MHIDLNADVGEECGDDAALIPLLSSANVCCGVHAGGPETMRRTVARCVTNSVAIGAHFSYPDREHFGRRDLDLPPTDITASVLQQLRELDAIARVAGSHIRYLKAHGALYNRMAVDAVVADAVIAALKAFEPSLPLLTLPDCTAMTRARSQGVTVVGEAFADRGYRDDGRLQPRGEAGALLTDSVQVSERVVTWLRTGSLPSVTGKPLKITARSLCVHGDTPGAAKIAGHLCDALRGAGIAIEAFA